MKYITSDLHFWHKNIIKYCNRPYTVDALWKMNEDILKEFDKLPENSIVLNLGDIMLNSSKNFDDLKYLVDRMKMNGKKLEILLGNHDKTLPKFLKMKDKSAVEIFYRLGFDKVYTEPFIQDGMLFTHEPIIYKEQPNIKIIHGHTHDKDVDENYFGEKINVSNYINVCWDKIHRILPYEELVKQ